MDTWWRLLTRKKRLDPLTISTETQLARVLSTFDLTALGVGSTLGVGVYVLAGHVAKDTAGPSVVLSFLIAAIASVFAGLCYAEFGARVPRAGSAYIYSYVCVGELIAFIIGWNLILEYVIGSASVARGLSLYLDTLLNNTLKDTFREIAPISSSFMSEYFDFLSFGITLLLGVALAFGLKESSLANNIFTVINIGVVLFVIIAGSIKADPHNWSIKKSEIPQNINGGEGGFFPFGIAGTIKGAATCFYGFVGFDCIATTGEEVRNPQRAIPIAIILSLFIIFLSYFGTSAVVTLMWPYYLQDPDAPIPHAFSEIGWDVAKWIVAIGGIFGLCASLFGAMFPLPRIIYAMASDSLVFRFLGSVNSRFRTPVVGTLLAALLTGLMSALFNLKQLVNMMSIGTLMAYTIVAACVVILRYTTGDGQIYSDDAEEQENLHLISPRERFTVKSAFKQMFNYTKRTPTYLTQKLVTVLVFLFCVLALALAACLTYLQDDLEDLNLWAVIPTSIIGLLLIVILASMYAQPTSNTTLSFKVPLVPLIPALSILINLYLMMMLDGNTWIRFGVWMAVGLPIYFASLKLYKLGSNKIVNKNGKINHGFKNENQNGKTKENKTLTIPKIVVVPPTNFTLNSEAQTETKENSISKPRKSVFDINKANKVISELDRVLDEQFLDSRISGSSDLENESPKSFDQLSICSSSSEDSEEHHVEAIVHQEDTDDHHEEIKELNKDQQELQKLNNDHQELKEINSDHHQELKDFLQEKIIAEARRDSDNVSIILTDEDLNAESEDKTTPRDTNKFEFNGPNNEEVNEDKNCDPDQSNEDTKYSDDPSKPKIPIPPPMSGLLIHQMFNSPSKELKSPEEEQNSPESKPRKKSPRPPLFTPENLGKVVLKPIPVLRTRTESLSSVSSVENVKPGSARYRKIQKKLDGIFKNYIPIGIPEPKNYQEDKSPSPAVAKELELIDQVLEQYEEEIPQGFAKTKEFKDTLNNLLMRKHSTVSNKPEYVRKYETNNPPSQNDIKADEVKHKRLMANTLRSIKLRRTGILDLEQMDNDNPDNDDKNNDEESDETNKETTEKEKTSEENNEVKNSESPRPSKTEYDKEKHKKLMIATLRSLKLRKTGISLEDEDNKDDEKEDNKDGTISR